MITRDRHRPAIDGVKSGGHPVPGSRAIGGYPQPDRCRGETDAGLPGMRRHFVNVGRDIHGLCPLSAPVDRTEHSPDVDVDVEVAVAVGCERTHIRGPAPRGVPLVTTRSLIEARDRHETAAVDPEEPRFRPSHEQATRGRDQAVGAPVLEGGDFSRRAP